MGTEAPTFIDLFAGCGGLSLGLTSAGWRGLFAVEKDSMAFATLQHNLINDNGPARFEWPQWLPLRRHDIDQVIRQYRDRVQALLGSIDLIAGGPPCQGFSSAGRRDGSDKRNKLVHSYIEFIRITHPKILFFENVKGFTFPIPEDGKACRPCSQVVVEKLKALGYADVVGKIIDFSDFGVPQRRKRFIIVATTFGHASDFFDGILKRRRDFLRSKGIRTKTGTRAVISDLERRHGETVTPDRARFTSGYYGKVITQYQDLLRRGVTAKVPDSHSFARHKVETLRAFRLLLESAPRDKKIWGEDRIAYGIGKRGVTVLAPDAVSPTLTSHPDDYVHYREPRILTVRECARLQTFPDWFHFKAKYTTGGDLRAIQVPRYTQVGNAIPPLFAELSGQVLLEMLHKNGT